MILETTITISPEDENNQSLIKKLIFEQLKKESKKEIKNDDVSFVLKKKSIDARKNQIRYHMRYAVYIGEKPGENDSFKPKWKNAAPPTVVIVGSGPAGLFGALKLLEYGIKPVILERGSTTSKRKVDIANISRTSKVDENSNYCFGEGGAGTFSDGKLYTRSNKRGNIEEILQIFVYHGASPDILTSAHPHIGTDKLPKIVNNMVETIRKYGGEVYFDTRVTGFITDNSIVKGVRCGEKEFFADAVLLATGHSATDIYTLLDSIDRRALEPKTYAVGVRVEHPREVIDKIQYHGKERNGVLPAAEYRLVTQVENRGVYSFCMCPGGNVVPSQSENESIVVNGMSCSSRNSPWSNAAIVVEIRPEDCAQGSLNFRTNLERMTFVHGDGQKAPAQRLVDFLAGRDSVSLPKSSYAPGLVPSRLDQWLPDFIVSRLKTAFRTFDSQMHGFICEDALLIATETRTSTPVRILRDKESFESPVLRGLYPAGEGSGYAGGITSSAMDGANAADRIASRLGGGK